MKNFKNFYQIIANFLKQHKKSASMIFKSQPEIEKRPLIDLSEMDRK